jgi:hypothetical protein
MESIMLRNAIALSFLLAFAAPAWAAPLEGSLKELRQSFTIRGKPVPPEIFADFGDADLADSGAIRVTIDLLAALGSNLYGDEITASPGGWISQKKTVADGAQKLTEETSYKFDGVTRNGLLVVTAAFSGGGSGDFFTLHILDAAASRAFDSEGKLYDRLNLTIVRSIPLGDRWDGDVKIAGDRIAITAEPHEPTSGASHGATRFVEAARP